MSLWVVLEGIWIRSETVNIAGYQMRLLVRRVVNKTLKFRPTFLILLTINLLVTVNLKPEIISQGDRELIVNLTILETWDETWASYLRHARQANAFVNQQCLPSLIGFKSLPNRLIKTQEQRKMHFIILLANTAFGLPVTTLVTNRWNRHRFSWIF